MKRKYILPGLLLILSGLYFLIASLPGIVMPAGLFLIAVGAALLISRLFAHRRYGLTIAGFILFWLGAGRLMLDVLNIGGQYGLVATPLAIALAFFLTHIFEYRRLGNWPMIPALILLGFAVMFFLILTPSVNSVLKPYYGTILPFILIVVGVTLLVRGGKRGKKADDQPIEPEYIAFEQNIPSPDQWAQPPVEPVAEPVVVTPEPVAVEPEPAVVPEPAVAEPVAVEPEPTAAEPEPVAEEPETLMPETEVLPEEQAAETPEELRKTDAQAE